jgi:predicted AlkP superfamily pyrophosphatase or phosphodiesterase
LTEPGPDTVEPRYGRGALVDVLPAALAATGAPGWPSAITLPPAPSYVVFLVDGLGWGLLRRHRDVAPYLNALADSSEPITCGLPSTTATSLTSLGTALPPGRHGVVGFTSRVPGTDTLLDALRWDQPVDPREWQPHETVFGRARAAGVATTTVSKRVFQGSGLTVASQRGADYVGADTPGERISATVHASAEPGSLVYVYEGELDSTGHAKGCLSWAWEHQLGVVDSFAQRLREALPSTTALLVTADHGMVDVEPDQRINVDDIPELLDGVILVGGEARFRHLYCAGGAVESVASAWRAELGERALVLTRDEAVGRGWFGEVDAAVRPRIGDVVVASLGRNAVVSTARFKHESKLIGFHGSLTADEMLIPLLVDHAG